MLLTGIVLRQKTWNGFPTCAQPLFQPIFNQIKMNLIELNWEVAMAGSQYKINHGKFYSLYAPPCSSDPLPIKLNWIEFNWIEVVTVAVVDQAR